MILVINTGSSSVKFGVYSTSEETLVPLCRGSVVNIGTSPAFSVKGIEGVETESNELDSNVVTGHDEAVKYVLDWVSSSLPDENITVVGHRVVHGGAEFCSPVIINKEILKNLVEFEKLAPLHQPYNVAGISAFMKAHPGIPQVACFDTSFHRTQPRVAEMFGLPDEFYDEGVRRYGFHGLSYEYIAGKLRETDPTLAGGRIIVAHLGNGASMCAIKEGKSVASTMGFTAVDGLPMGTRSGSIDPGVIIYLLNEKGYDTAEVEDLIYKRSGLLGISGISNDMKVLISSEDPWAELAVEYFVYRAQREIGSLSAALGGLDALIFTAGIGENSPEVREKICTGLSWLGIHLDAQANSSNEELISLPGKSPSVHVIPTNEELMIAVHTKKALSE